eukprot:gb/GECG01013978.1/.p1 GENE.gb/GECG01013978.1/~~gb/GECG01013978.1/.p1  ORF type:complete len:194 (+),score=11.28 gb/GECG01013978.1/:1-582(+)
MEVSLNAIHRGLQLSFHVINRVHTALVQAQAPDATHRYLINTVCLALSSGASLQHGFRHQRGTQEQQHLTAPIQLSASAKDTVANTIEQLHRHLESYTQERQQHPEWDAHPVTVEHKKVSLVDVMESVYSVWNAHIDTHNQDPHLTRSQLFRYFEGIKFVYRYVVRVRVVCCTRGVLRNGLGGSMQSSAKARH